MHTDWDTWGSAERFKDGKLVGSNNRIDLGPDDEHVTGSADEQHDKVVKWGQY